MQYDKESIKQAQKQGVLDSDLDAYALGISDNEKQRIASQLRQSVADHEADDTPLKPVNRSRKKNNKKQPDTFWDKLVGFFKSLFSGMSRDMIMQKRELRDYERKLSNFSVPVYDPKTKQVKAKFAALLYKLHSEANVFADFFTARFLIGKDKFFSDRKPGFLGYLLEQLLSDRQKQILWDFRNADFQKEFSLRGEEEVVRDYEAAIKNFSADYSSANVARIESQLDFYTSLINLRNYNYRSYFSVYLKGSATLDAPQFRDFALSSSLAFLKKMDSYLNGVALDKYEEFHEAQLQEYNRAMDEAGGDEQDEESGVIMRYDPDRFAKVVKSLRKVVNNKLVTYLIRLGTENIYYKPKPVINSISYVDKYRTMVVNSLRERLESEVTRFREQRVAAEVGELFEGFAPPEQLPVINSDMSHRLKLAGSDGFDGEFVFGLLINYLEKIYFERYRKHLNQIVVEGEFRKPELANEFSENYYRIDQLYDECRNLLQEVREDTKLGTKLKEFAAGKVTNVIGKNKVIAELDELNERLRDLTSALASALIRLHNHMEVFMRDFKGIRQTELVNAKQIGGLGNRSLSSTLDLFFITMRKLKGVLSKFVVVEESV